MISPLSSLLLRHQPEFHPLISFDPATQKLSDLNLTTGGDLPLEIAGEEKKFERFMEELRILRGADFLVGGYAELRDMYHRSEIFSSQEEPRRLHLGVDVWGPAGTPVFAFMGGMVHSTGFNEQLGDYGATMILLHQLEGIPFYTLYGHISLADIRQVAAGQYITRGQEIAHFGKPDENGHWPPHLHFQVMSDIGLAEGDYPGVCRWSERQQWLDNCPDPDLILQWCKHLPSV